MPRATGIEHQNGQFVAGLISHAASGAAYGALASHLFQITSPVGGAIFGAGVLIASPFIYTATEDFLINPCLRLLNIKTFSVAQKVLVVPAALSIHLSSATAVTYAFGYSITLPAATALFVSVIGMRLMQDWLQAF